MNEPKPITEGEIQELFDKLFNSYKDNGEGFYSNQPLTAEQRKELSDWIKSKSKE